MHVPDILPYTLSMFLTMLHWVCYQLKALQQLILKELNKELLK